MTSPARYQLISSGAKRRSPFGLCCYLHAAISLHLSIAKRGIDDDGGYLFDVGETDNGPDCCPSPTAIQSLGCYGAPEMIDPHTHTPLVIGVLGVPPDLPEW